MGIIDTYLLHFLIFSPLIASLFITLIPTNDINSKIAISKFFALIIVISYCKIFFASLNNNMQADMILSNKIGNLNINLIINISKTNIFLYGIASLMLVIYFFLFEFIDSKTNIHQVAPFLLTFFLFISMGQKDIRVAMPILSISNFLIYFMIGYTNKIRRGSSIFHMGVFLFSCDALALVTLQMPSIKLDSLFMPLLFIILLAPGMARLCLPLFSPFTKKLLLNVDEFEGPFIMVFLQISGFIISLMIKNELRQFEETSSLTIAYLSMIGAFYIALVAITGKNIRTMPYYYLVFYTSFSIFLLFIIKDDKLSIIATALFLNNLICFIFTSRLPLIINTKYTSYSSNQIEALCFISLCMFIGLPGLGIGTTLWISIYHLASINISILVMIVIWFIILLLLSLALIISIKIHLSTKELNTIKPTSSSLKLAILWSPLFIICISWLIPLIIFYANYRGT